MASQTVTVSVLADTKRLQSSFQGLSSKLGLGKIGGAVKGLGVAVARGAAVGGTALVGLGVVGTRAASDLQQSVGAVDAVFKGNADTIHSWAKGAATDLGLTQHSYNELSTVIGTQLKQAGVPMGELAGQTDDLITRSADLAAMFGGPVTQSSEAMAAALRGEFEPLRRYGVSLSVAEIEAQALADTGKTVTSELTKQEKALATQALIMQQSSDAAGQFARESDTLAGRTERLKAQLGNLAAQIGTYLLPAVSAVVGWLSDNLAPAVETVTSWVKANLLPALQQLGSILMANVVPVLQEMGTWVMSTLVPALQALWERVTGLAGGSGAGMLSQALTRLQAIFTTVYGIIQQVVPIVVQFATELIGKLMPAAQAIAQAIVGQLLPAVQQLWQLIGPVLIPVLQTVSQVLQFLAGILIETVKGAVTGVIQAFSGLVGMIQGAVALIGALFTGDWSAAWQALKDIGSAALDFIVGAVKTALNVGVLGLFRRGLAALRSLWSGGLNAIRSTATSVWNAITSFLSGIWSRIRGLFSSALANIRGTVSSVMSSIRGTISSVMSTIRSVFSGAWDAMWSLALAGMRRISSAVSSGINNVLSFMRGLPGRILGALGNLGSTLYGVGRDLLRGMVNGLWSMASWLGSQISALVSRYVPGPIKSILGIASPSKLFAQFGRNTIEGLVLGLNRAAPDVGRTMQSISRDMARTPLQLRGELAMSASTNGGRNGAPRKYEINIHTLAPSAEVGRAVSEALRDFEAYNGVLA